MPQQTPSEVCRCADEVLSLSQLFDWVIEKGKTGVASLRKDTHMTKIANVERACGMNLELVRRQVETAYDYYSPVYFEHAKKAFEKSLRTCATGR